MAQTKVRWYTRTTRSKKWEFMQNWTNEHFSRTKGREWPDVAKDIYFGPTPTPPAPSGTPLRMMMGIGT